MADRQMLAEDIEVILVDRYDRTGNIYSPDDLTGLLELQGIIEDLIKRSYALNQQAAEIDAHRRVERKA
jgi:hypothetical protein